MWNMKQGKELTNQEKVNQILVDIEKNLQYKETEHSRTMDKFSGKIGDAVTFAGKIQGNRNFSVFCDPDAEICLSDHNNQKIAEIRMKYAGFICHFCGFRVNSDRSNQIQIISPAWNKKNGVKTVINKTWHGGLSVFHAKDETADALIDNLYNVVELSQAKMEITQKLSKLNLPSNIKIKNMDVIAENLLQQIHEQNQDNGRTVNTNADNGREM